MISKSQIKLIHSLRIKKYRKEKELFIAEGVKLVLEALHSSFEFHSIFATDSWIKANQENFRNLESKIFPITEAELKKISSLSTPNQVLAILQIPEYSYDKSAMINSLSLALDDIQDPGNLGSIIRIADWFGITDIFCSLNCVDIYNPKVIQSSMGSICRVRLHYVDLMNLLKNYSDEEMLIDAFNVASKEEDFNIYGAFLEGENIFDSKLSSHGIIVLGNESSGISKELLPYINKKLFIPNYSPIEKSIDSLNVSVASAIVCSEFRRRAMKSR